MTRPTRILKLPSTPRSPHPLAPRSGERVRQRGPEIAVALMVALGLALGASPGCERAGGEGPHAVDDSEPAASPSRDFLKLDPKSPRMAFLKIDVVRESDVPAVVSLPGRVSVDEDHTQRVASPIDGRVVALFVKPGEVVRAGQPLLELASPQVGLLQADAAKAAEDLSVTERAVVRVRRLKADGAVSEKEVAQIEADFKKAQADVARSAAQLHSLGISAAAPTVKVALRAQIAGTVIERPALVGQEVRADGATPLLTISNLDRVWVLGAVYERDLSLIDEKDVPVTVHVPAYPGEDFAGRVIYIGEVVDPVTRTVQLRCALDNPKHRLKPEMFASIDVQSIGGKRFISVPGRAVLAEGEKYQVIVASEGNVFRARQVEVGSETGDRVRILRGLTPGEKIVVDGALFLKRELAD